MKTVTLFVDTFQDTTDMNPAQVSVTQAPPQFPPVHLGGRRTKVVLSYHDDGTVEATTEAVKPPEAADRGIIMGRRI